MIQNFKAYNLAVQLYRQVETLRVPAHSRDQLLRAAQSIVLNLAEGSGKPTPKDKKRFYAIAFGSTREVQSLFDIINVKEPTLVDLLDHVAACVYRLAYKAQK